MLKSQVNPHFLFNTLNMISCMAQLEEADTTDKMILAMSRLFQYTLKSSESTAPLSNEIAVVKDYLYLQKMRFGERVQYEIDVEDDTEYRMVPSFILQPLVENAVIHGISGQASGGFIRVRSWTEGKKLWLSVEDTGAGMEPEQVEQLNSGKWKGKSGHGVGLGNIIKAGADHVSGWSGDREKREEKRYLYYDWIYGYEGRNIDGDRSNCCWRMTRGSSVQSCTGSFPEN